MFEERLGAANPYALAELISRTRIDWKTVRDKKALLEDVFGMSYEELFKIGDSPLFPGKTNPELEFITVTSGRCRQAFETIYLHERPIRNLADRDLLDYLLANIEFDKRGSTFDPDHDLEEAIQGIIPNCYLISSISAIDAIDADYFKRMLIPDHSNIGKYSIDLLNPEPGGKQYSISLSAGMCWLRKWYDQAGQEMTGPPDQGQNWTERTVLAYSRSDSDEETWCGMIEKAYYMMIDQMNSVQNGFDPPNYNIYGGNNSNVGLHSARYAMSSLLKIPFDGKYVPGSTHKLTVDDWYINGGLIGPTVQGPFNTTLQTFLNRVCGNRTPILVESWDWTSRLDLGKGMNVTKPGSIYPKGMHPANRGDIIIEEYSALVTRPVVARTLSNMPSQVGASANLVPFHSYTVLGYFYIKRHNGTDMDEYIVLRNPWGQTEMSTEVYGGIWVAMGPDGGYHLRLPDDDGVFAMRFDAFLECFDLMTCPNMDMWLIDPGMDTSAYGP